ncbi:hypothetical protein D6D17_05889 [Aureobasidium pullulans]|nr:hypothetical protein D6D17_05889 [Aureobasidium pullulans]THY97306.1 hypothetical protein D6C92_03467 [Aureobasidium pullulans]TIA14424.1 hypothetical protein D6C81_06736 [Aureobasidium pullulans]
MAAAKRAYDVISINSDSSEDETIMFERPLKMARRNKTHRGLNYFKDDDDLQQHNMDDLMRAGPSVRNVRNSSPKHAQGHSATSPQTVDSSEHDFDPSFPFDYEDFPNAHDDEIPDPLDGIIMLHDLSPSPAPDFVPEPTTLDQIMEIVPDVCRTYAFELLVGQDDNVERVIEQLFDKPYPKASEVRAGLEAERQAELRAQKVAEEAEKANLLNPQYIFSGKMKDVIIEVLKDEFNTIPIKYIRETQKEKKHLYATYLALNEAKHADLRPYGKTPWRPLRDVNFQVLQGTKDQKANIPVLMEQFNAARRAAAEWNIQRRKSIAQKKLEEETAALKAQSEEKNLELAKASGKLAECAACFDEYPLNRVVRCNSADAHFVCFDCMKTYLESETGQSSFKLACPGGCGNTFGEFQLRLVPETHPQVDELMRLRQEHDIRTAGIEDVEGCPFCDFKTVCLPIEVDFEFHCQNEDCSVTSCRKCKEKTHIPESCEEFQRKRSKDAALGHRHKIEEARSKALIRNCNSCKRAFIKSEGCNKMTCPTCNNIQCYLCGANVTANYSHFQPPNPCPTFDEKLTIEARHDQEVKAAAEAAEAEVLRDHPELNKEHLHIKFSDSVTEAEKRVLAPPMPPPRQGAHIPNLLDGVLLRGQQAQDRRRAQRVDQPHRPGNILNRFQGLGAAVFGQPRAPGPVVDHLNPIRQEPQANVGAHDHYAPDMALHMNDNNHMQPRPAFDRYFGGNQAAPGDLDFANFAAQAGAEMPGVGNDFGFEVDFNQNWEGLQAFPAMPGMPAMPVVPPIPVRPAAHNPGMNLARDVVQNQIDHQYGNGNLLNMLGRPRQGNAAQVPAQAPIENNNPGQDNGYGFGW